MAETEASRLPLPLATLVAGSPPRRKRQNAYPMLPLPRAPRMLTGAPQDRSAKQHPRCFQTQRNGEFYVLYSFFRGALHVSYTTNKINFVGGGTLSSSEIN